LTLSARHSVIPGTPVTPCFTVRASARSLSNETGNFAGKTRVPVEADVTSVVVAGTVVAAVTYGARWLSRPLPPVVTLETLKKQDSETSSAIIAVLRRNPVFINYSKGVTKSIMARDDEDGEKLAKGIQIAVEKNVLPASVKVEPIHKIYVEGKSASAVADEIIVALGDAPSKGCVMTLQGLSGTGKGTTVEVLKKRLPNCATWSNGNVFRSLTLLAVTYAEQNGCTLNDALKPELLASFVKMLEFGEFNGKFDVKIEGLGMRYFVSEIMNTKLQAVSKSIPTVAEVTQGEVVNFVQGALAKMAAAGKNVLVEGREQTLNHIRTPLRFELVLKDPNIIGMRRAAQYIAGIAYEELKAQPDASDAAVLAAIQRALAKVAAA